MLQATIKPLGLSTLLYKLMLTSWLSLSMWGLEIMCGCMCVGVCMHHVHMVLLTVHFLFVAVNWFVSFGWTCSQPLPRTQEVG